MKVLIVDDSIVYRSAISRALAGEEGIEVVGVAGNGKIALKKLEELEVDLVTLDMEMPEMDGLTTIKEIRKGKNQAHILVFSTLTHKGASVTMEALSLGANDFLVKSQVGGSIEKNVESIKKDLVPKIRQFYRGGERRGSGIPVKKNPPGSSPAATTIPLKAEVIGIGSSTGGPEALKRIFGALGPVGIPLLIAQHMPPIFTDHLARSLDKLGKIRVKEAEEGEELRGDTGYIAPGDYHMVIKKKGGAVTISLNQEEKINSVRPAVDPLFRSIAEIYGPNSRGVILTGMGEDGLRGAKIMHERGAPIFIQNEESSVVWGMPGAVYREGFQREVLTLANIARRIEESVGKRWESKRVEGVAL